MPQRVVYLLGSSQVSLRFRVRIAFVLSQSLDSPSGLGRFGPLARELAKQEHAVSVFALHYDWGRLSPKRYSEQGVAIAYVGQMHVRKEGPRKLYFSPGRLLLVSLTSALRLASALWKSDAEIIQLCKPQPINALAARLGRRGRPIYCDCDDYEAATNRFSGVWQRRIVQHFEDGVISYAVGLTVNTRFTFNRFAELGYPTDRIIYVPNGVERSRFEAPQGLASLRQRWGLDAGTPVVAYVGTLSILSHAVDLLMEAFAIVAKHFPTARLLLVGGGEDYDRLVTMAAQLGIAGQTIFAGRLPSSEIPAVLSLATVSTDPVRDDPVAAARSPLKVVESLAVGTPVVTGDVGDRRAMLDNGALGVLVQPGDPGDLAHGLMTVLGNPAGRGQMALADLATREAWYWDHLGVDFARIYQDAGSYKNRR